ncbi:uncharacterized protein LOC135681917 [Rhopilema esculentum]|uniref:uncharacterized protein LOC135681917 n=1 Tax=Rhopilema esculentum TaxID=499914 RepID=UPI0031D59263|eukprot:gene14752-5858_t
MENNSIRCQMGEESRDQGVSRKFWIIDSARVSGSEQEEFSESPLNDQREQVNQVSEVSTALENVEESFSKTQPNIYWDSDDSEFLDMIDCLPEEARLSYYKRMKLPRGIREQRLLNQSRGLKRKKSSQNKAGESKCRRKEIIYSQRKFCQSYEDEEDHSGYDTDSEDEDDSGKSRYSEIVEESNSLLEAPKHEAAITSAAADQVGASEDVDDDESDYPEFDSDFEVDDPMFFRDDDTMPLPDFEPMVDMNEENDAGEDRLYRRERDEDDLDEDSDNGYESDQEDARKGFALIPTQQGMAIRFKNFQSIVPYLNSLLPGQLNQSGVLNLHYHPSTYPFTRNALLNFQRNIAAAFDQPIVDEVIVIDSDSEDESDEAVAIDSDSEDETNEVITIESDSEDESQEDDLPQQQIDNREDVSAGIASYDSLPRYDSGNIEHEELIDEAIDGSVENLNSQEVTLENPILEEQPHHQWYLDSSISPLVQSSLVNEQPNEVFVAENSASENMPPCCDAECQTDDNLEDHEEEECYLCEIDQYRYYGQEEVERSLPERISFEQQHGSADQQQFNIRGMETNDVKRSCESHSTLEESDEHSVHTYEERCRMSERQLTGSQTEVIDCSCSSNRCSEDCFIDQCSDVDFPLFQQFR